MSRVRSDPRLLLSILVLKEHRGTGGDQKVLWKQYNNNIINLLIVFNKVYKFLEGNCLIWISNLCQSLNMGANKRLCISHIRGFCIFAGVVKSLGDHNSVLLHHNPTAQSQPFHVNVPNDNLIKIGSHFPPFFKSSFTIYGRLCPNKFF